MSVSESQRLAAKCWGYGLLLQPALQAIRYANVRFGILPPRSLALTSTCIVNFKCSTHPMDGTNA
jgi:hypothetical protein